MKFEVSQNLEKTSKMKKLLVLIYVFLLGELCSGQQYVPFFSESKQWTYMQTLFLTGNGAEIFRVEKGYFQGDTLWNDVKFSKFYKEQVQPNPEVKELSYFFREDTIEKKVYVHDFHFNKTALLYDFSLNEGDSFNIYIVDNLYLKNKVLKVDTIFTNNKKLKRIEFENSIVWIEGVGSVTKTIIPSEGELICVKDNNSVLYLNGNLNNCDTIFPQGPFNSIQEKTVPAHYIFNVYPNPIETTSVIRAESNNNQSFIIEIYNSLGILVKKDRFVDNYPIGLIHLKRGLYIYQLKIDNDIINSNKLIVK